MFTKTQAEIMKVFTSKINEKFSIKQISEILKKSYPLIHRSTTLLIRDNFILKDSKDLLSLNYKENLMEIAYIESLRTKQRLKNRSFSLFVNDVLTNISSDFFVFLVFGSFVESDSARDIDILLITPDNKKISNIEKAIENVADNFSLKLHVNVISIESVYEMLSKRDNANIMNETLNKHLLIFGAENYYRILKMLDKKILREIEKNVKQLSTEGKIIKDKEEKYTKFFLKNAQDSFNSAKLLFNISIDNILKKSLGFPNFNGYLWVINSSYYSMFYMARALLESNGVKIKTEQSIHAITYNALVYYFYLTKKIEKTLIEEFQRAGMEASEILGKEKAKQLIEDYSNEKYKRERFTYEMGEIAMQNKAQTSLDRAKKFNEEIRKLIKQN